MQVGILYLRFRTSESQMAGQAGQAKQAEQAKEEKIKVQLSLSEEPPESWFQSISRTLFGKCVLRCQEKTYAIAEVEYYLYIASHPDPYVHKNPQQMKCGEWYFHRASSAKIGFTLKGLDLTFGGEERWGGILIRAIRPLAEGKLGPIIEGPSKVVDAILTDCGVTSVMELHGLDEYSHDAFECPHLSLARAPVGLLKPSLAVGPRIGLRARPKDLEAVKYHTAQYRHHAYPAQAKKEKKNLKLIPLKD